jgi:hypothetical protein
MILNASGCLDALEAPEVARALDAFQNGEPHGSPVSPLLDTSQGPSWAPGGQSPAPPAIIHSRSDQGEEG